ncbi:MAG: hypothetical protein WCA44_17975 [Acidobacteriaceae bacterium]
MERQSQIDVTQWQATARRWNYTPEMQFFARLINTALIECKCMLGVAVVSRGVLVATPLPSAHTDWRPSDAALLARDWIARSGDEISYRFVGFATCCLCLGAVVDPSRVSLLATIDAAGDYDNDKAWARLEQLRSRPIEDDTEPLFAAPRCIPAVDQGTLF